MPRDLRVELDGKKSDLAIASDCFRDFDPRIEIVDGAYCLVSATFAGIDDPAVLHRAATAMIRELNRAMKMHDTAQRDVHLKGISFLNDDGKRQRILYLTTSSGLHVRGRVSMTGTIAGEKPRPTNCQRYLKLAAVSDAARDVLRYWSVEPRDGGWLYKAYEVIEHDMGRNKGIAAAGLASLTELGRFTASVNRSDVTGDFARHARTRGLPPRNPMDEADATCFVQTLAIKWLLHKYEIAVADGTIVE